MCQALCWSWVGKQLDKTETLRSLESSFSLWFHLFAAQLKAIDLTFLEYSTCLYHGNMVMYVFNHLSGGGTFLGVKLFRIMGELMFMIMKSYKGWWRQEMM